MQGMGIDSFRRVTRARETCVNAMKNLTVIGQKVNEQMNLIRK